MATPLIFSHIGTAKLAFIAFLSISLTASCRPFHSCHTAFSFPDFRRGLHKLAILGDARVSPFNSDRKSLAVEISGSKPRSAGWLFYSNPVSLLPSVRIRDPASFSSFFAFSMSENRDDRLAFVMAPGKNFGAGQLPRLWLSSSLGSAGWAHSLADEFESALSGDDRDLQENHLNLDIGDLVSPATRNVSYETAKFNDVERVYAWIDYLSPAKMLEVRLSKSQFQRPSHPVLSRSIEFPNEWKEEMYVGFHSSAGDSPHKHMLHSWSFSIMDESFPGHHHGFHHGSPFDKTLKEILRIVLAISFGAACGTVIGASVLLVLSLLRRIVTPSYSGPAMQPVLLGYQPLPQDGK